MRAVRPLLLGVTALVAAGACGAPSSTPSSGSPVDGGAGVPDAATSPTVTPIQHDPTPAPSLDGTVETRRATSLGTNAFSANGRVQPGGRPTKVWFEYGKTSAYGQKTAAQPLGPQRTAHYKETWDRGLEGWFGGVEMDALSPVASGGTGGSPFVRFSAPSDFDSNHLDGIGFLQLTQYVYVGTVTGDRFPSAAWGGGDPDLRDAQVRVQVRGNAFSDDPAELTFWAQSDIDLAQQNDEYPIRANWAHTGYSGMDLVWSGGWRTMSYALENDSNAWSFGGWSREQVEAFGRNRYPYAPIDYTLRHLNCDLMHVLTQIRADQPPAGTIDYDELEITYRNHSVLIASNGGALVSAPPGGTSAEQLTDGWRNGTGHVWRSAPNPTTPQEFVYRLELPVDIEAVQIHQDPDWPSQDVEVLVSDDGATWYTVLAGRIPETSPAGANHTFLLNREIVAEASYVKVRVLSGYKPGYWGLGEIEVFGSGAVQATDSDWYSFSQDIVGLEPGATYHYRFVAESEAGVVYGGDKLFIVPDGKAPEVVTGGARRLPTGTHRFEGRVNPLGLATLFKFEYGEDTSYGTDTETAYAGWLDSPRTVIANVRDLVPGRTYHYRLVVMKDPDQGTVPFPVTYGADATFMAQ